MTNPPSSKDLLGGAAKAFKFDAIGDVAQGTVVNSVVRQVTNMRTNEPEFFKSGDPKWQIVATLQTTMREDADDDGLRTLYIKSYMFNAVKQAIQTVGADDLERGGYLTVVHTGVGEAERGMSPPKFFGAEYKRPSAQLLAQGAPQQQYMQPQAAPAPAQQYAQPAPQQYAPPLAPEAPAPAPAPAAAPPAPAAAPPPANGPTQEQLAAVIRAGLDPEVVFPGYRSPR